MIEEWRSIAGFYGYYEVSNLGRVRSLRSAKLLAQSMRRDGYLKVSLRASTKVRYAAIHRLVAEAFLQPDALRPNVNHLNGLRTDNRSSNLEWCTLSENNQHAIHVLKSAVTPFGRPRAIVGVRIDDGTDVHFRCLSDAGRAGFSTSNIAQCCNGRRSKHLGYSWAYA